MFTFVSAQLMKRKNNIRFAVSAAAFTPFGTLLCSVDRLITSNYTDALCYPASLLVRKLRSLFDLHLLCFCITIHDYLLDTYTYKTCNYTELRKLLKSYE